MKRISFFIACLLFTTSALRAQDAATEEKLNRLNGLVQDLLEDKTNQKKQIAELAKEIASVREQASKPTGNYASQDDLRQLAKKVQEVEDNRQKDNERILKEMSKLVKTIAPVAGTPKKTPDVPKNTAPDGPPSSDKGYEYIIKKDDTYSVIAQTYREQGIKITSEQIEKANPGVSPTKLKVGQKIFIPAPQP